MSKNFSSNCGWQSLALVGMSVAFILMTLAERKRREENLSLGAIHRPQNVFVGHTAYTQRGKNGQVLYSSGPSYADPGVQWI